MGWWVCNLWRLAGPGPFSLLALPLSAHHLVLERALLVVIDGYGTASHPDSESPGQGTPSSTSFFIYLLFLVVLGLHCWKQPFSSCDDRGYSWLWCWVSPCSCFSCCRARALGCVGFSSCGTWAWKLWLLGPRAQDQ